MSKEKSKEYREDLEDTDQVGKQPGWLMLHFKEHPEVYQVFQYTIIQAKLDGFDEGLKQAGLPQ